MIILKRRSALTVFALFWLTGCSLQEGTTTVTTITTEQIDAEEVLTLDPTADIFQFEGIVYQTNIDWVNELTLTKDTQVGEIKYKNDLDLKFRNGMSNKLPIGTKILSTKERGSILIVELDGQIKKYLAIVEG